MTTMLSQLGFGVESTYGTGVTPARFLEFNSCGIALERGAVMSKGLRTGTRVQRADRFMPYTVGAAGDIVFDVPTKGFGIWLQHMLGTIATGTITDSNYTHTATIGSLAGRFLTIQAGKPRVGSSTVDPYTWTGCKVTNWELACDVDGILVATVGVDAQNETRATALATASYPADFRVFTFDGCSVTIAGDSFEALSWSASGNNQLDVGRRFLTGSSLKKEPLENAHREYGVSLEAEYRDLTQYNRFVAGTAAGQLASVVATFVGPVAHGGTTLPQLVVTMPAVRFAEVSQPISGPETLKQSITGEVVDNGTDQPITITYRTTDATP
jgi:hypothetical protein